MSWNYRVIRKKYKTPSGRNENYLEIHEVYYDDKNKPNGVTENAVTIGGEDIKSLRWSLEQIELATHKKILDYSFFEKQTKEKNKNETAKSGNRSNKKRNRKTRS